MKRCTKSPCNPIPAAQSPARYELQLRMEYPDPSTDAATLFERAKERLASFTTVGFAEDFTSSLYWISHALKCREARPFEARNVNPERPRLAVVDNATLNLIRDLTQVDQRLYQFARSRFRNETWVAGRERVAGRELSMVVAE